MNALPLAYFLTWTTYGTWLPGDGRGWVTPSGELVVSPEPNLRTHSSENLRQNPVRLEGPARQLVTSAILEATHHYHWIVLALNVRTNHVHLVVDASNETPERVLVKLKAWSTRKLKAHAFDGVRVWTRHGSTRWINRQDDLEAAIRYVDQQ